MINEKITKIQRKQLDYKYWKFGVEIEADWGSEEKMREIASKFDAVVTEVYHGAEEYKGIKWVFEPDPSITVNDDDTYADSPKFKENGFVYEAVSPVVDINELESSMEYIFPLVTTNNTMGIHVSMSNKNIDFLDFDWLKFMLFFEEGYIYSKFPNRKNNSFAMSASDFLHKMINTKDYILLINQNKKDELIKYCKKWVYTHAYKMYGINFVKNKKGYVEFRYLGGASYNEKLSEIMAIIEMFVHTFNLVLSNSNNTEYHNKLQRLSQLSTNYSDLKLSLVNELDSDPFSLDALATDSRILATIDYVCEVAFKKIYSKKDDYSAYETSKDEIKKDLYFNFIHELRNITPDFIYARSITYEDVKMVYQSNIPLHRCFNALVSYKMNIVFNKYRIDSYKQHDLVIKLENDLRLFAGYHIETIFDNQQVKNKYMDIIYSKIIETDQIHSNIKNKLRSIPSNTPISEFYYDSFKQLLPTSPYKMELLLDASMFEQLYTFIANYYKDKLQIETMAEQIANHILVYLRKNAFVKFGGMEPGMVYVETPRFSNLFKAMNELITYKMYVIHKIKAIRRLDYEKMVNDGTISLQKLIDITVDYLEPIIKSKIEHIVNN